MGKWNVNVHLNCVQASRMFGILYRELRLFILYEKDLDFSCGKTSVKKGWLSDCIMDKGTKKLWRREKSFLWTQGMSLANKSTLQQQDPVSIVHASTPLEVNLLRSRFSSFVTISSLIFQQYPLTCLHFDPLFLLNWYSLFEEIILWTTVQLFMGFIFVRKMVI